MSRCISLLLRRTASQYSVLTSHAKCPVTYKPKVPHIFQITKCRNIQSSAPRQALPPILVLALRPLIKLTAMLFGRTIRKWWQRLPPDRRQQLFEKLRRRQSHITAGLTVLTGFGFFYYIEHVEEDPITKRKRFILYTEEQMRVISELEFENQIAMFSPEIVPPGHPIYRRVVRVANRILQGNNTLPQVKGKSWSVTVVDRPDVTNAFVLPHGKIVIFSGILNLASNDDQLAIVLSHEIAHALLQHMTENLSKAFFVEMVLLIPLVLFWALLPDVAALFSQWLSSRLADIMIHLPFSRAIEKEADVVGLELAAKACYDVREAPVFWGKMAQVGSKLSVSVTYSILYRKHTVS